MTVRLVVFNFFEWLKNINFIFAKLSPFELSLKFKNHLINFFEGCRDFSSGSDNNPKIPPLMDFPLIVLPKLTNTIRSEQLLSV